MELVYLAIYWTVVLLILGGFIRWQNHQRRTKRPMGEDVKARRQAGESLRMKLSELMEKLLLRVCGVLVVPLVAGILVMYVVSLKGNRETLSLMIATVAVVVTALILMVVFCHRLVAEIQNHMLGLFGERVVADELEVLRDGGFAIFHDVPCLGATGPFNLDHVVVGKGIVVVVETKTRRKPEDDPEGHKVRYDGQKLIWPNRTSTEEIEQALGNADWLRKELKERLGLEVRVKAALAFPGWYVTGGPPQAPVLVENPKRLPLCIAQRYPRELADEQVDLIRRHLDAKCRDVTFGQM